MLAVLRRRRAGYAVDEWGGESTGWIA